MSGLTLDRRLQRDRKYMSFKRSTSVIERCILMATDPGDLVLDPTCGSGTTAYVAEQWGRRWITIDTSRVALALARTRLMAARYPWYLLADSREGRAKEAELTQRVPCRHAGPQRHPPRLRLRARAAHHAQVDRQQSADRRHLGEVAGGARAAARRAQRRARQDLGRMADPARTARRRARLSQGAARQMVGGAHRPAEGDRRLDRRARRRRISLRQALRRQCPRPRRRAVHGREPVAASRAAGERGGTDRRASTPPRADARPPTPISRARISRRS